VPAGASRHPQRGCQDRTHPGQPPKGGPCAWPPGGWAKSIGSAASSRRETHSAATCLVPDVTCGRYRFHQRPMRMTRSKRYGKRNRDWPVKWSAVPRTSILRPTGAALDARHDRIPRQPRAPFVEVARELPAETALVAFARYHRLDGEPGAMRTRYRAFVLSGPESRPVILDLGDAAGIELVIADWRSAISQACAGAGRGPAARRFRRNGERAYPSPGDLGPTGSPLRRGRARSDRARRGHRPVRPLAYGIGALAGCPSGVD